MVKKKNSFGSFSDMMSPTMISPGFIPPGVDAEEEKLDSGSEGRKETREKQFEESREQ
ncbi:hypothetical protein [Desertibacillus haloalkaliphilus]|uniref:hypothetical protein n=1 Tax=Desertibacillus haloalkaliphilus TaxID=1328930 RepID=UPI001C2713AA|nr:hypothetical protein [Desertibacillus haloalkaliphilus]MBU8907205.1 hypothetical protein [Desertibacillus haloalkaliphilus]